MTEALKQVEEPLPRSRDFEARVLDHMGLTYAVAFGLTRNAADAHDLTQSAIVKALRFHHTRKNGTPIKAWLLTILRNTFIAEYRKTVRRPRFVEVGGAESAIQAGFETNTKHEPPARSSSGLLELVDDTVKQAVESLPEDFREAIVMADVEDLSYKEMAHAMKCPLGTVLSRLYCGRKLLRERLDEYAKSRRLAGKKGVLP